MARTRRRGSIEVDAVGEWSSLTVGRSSRKSQSSLPSWASRVTVSNAHTPSHNEQFQSNVNTQQVERLLRIESARSWHSKIRRAEEAAWRETVSKMMAKRNKCHQFINDPTFGASAQPMSIHPPSSDLALDHADHSDDYPWELLPTTVILPPPSCRLDRHVLMARALPSYLQSTGEARNTTQTCCPVHLPRLLPTLHATLHWILQQCLLQELDPSLQTNCQKTLYKRKRPKYNTTNSTTVSASVAPSTTSSSSSIQQQLLFWASQTQSFDSIVILLEDMGGYACANVWEEFISILQEWRCQWGLPIELIILSAPITTITANVNEINARVVSGSGLRIRHVSPSQYVWTQCFWNSLLLVEEQNSDDTKKSLPLLSMTHLTELLQRVAWNEDFPPVSTTNSNQLPVHRLEDPQWSSWSCTQFAQELITLITHFYEDAPGSFVWDSLQSHPSLTAWFATDSTAKQLLFDAGLEQCESPSTNGHHQGGTFKLQQFQKCQQLQTQLMWWWQWQITLIPLLTCQHYFTMKQQQPAPPQQRSPLAGIPSSTTNLLVALSKLFSHSAQYTDKTGTVPPSGPSEILKYYLQRVPDNKQNTFTDDNPHDKTNSSTPSSAKEVNGIATEKHKEIAITLLHELIILVGHFQQQQLTSSEGNNNNDNMKTSEESDTIIQTGLWQMIRELYGIVNDAMEDLLKEWKRSNPLSIVQSEDISNKDALDDGGELHHRRALVESLSSPAKELYALLQDRLSVSREEWLYLFGGSPIEFVRGVWTLVQSGLIQAKSKRATAGNSNNSQIVYEKVSVVWC